jgi:hypothetical protein
VLSWCFKREVKITSFAIRNDWGFWMEFSHYLTKGGDESIIELQFLNHPSVDFLDLVTTLEKSELILSSLKKLRFDFLGSYRLEGSSIPEWHPEPVSPVNTVIDLIGRCPELTELSLRWWSLTAADMNTLLYFLSEHSKLTHVYLQSGQGPPMDEDGILALLASSVGDRLESLAVSYWDFQEDKVLVAITTNCWQLQYLDLSGNDFSNDGLIRIARGCLHLKVLKLCFCDWVDDATFGELLSRQGQTSAEQLLVELEHLDISNCQFVHSIPLFCALLPRLNRLNIGGLSVSCATVDEFLKQHSLANPSGFIELHLDFEVADAEFEMLISRYPNAKLTF